MPIKLYNTLTRKKENLHKKPGETVSLYVCGITPYDKVHLGHARCYISFDVLRRYLVYRGYNVKHVQNFTDIDDKIIARAQKDGKHVAELAEKNIVEYFDQMKKLNVLSADQYPRVTHHIPDIINLIQKLIDKNHAYVAGGDVYYDVWTFPAYGCLSNRKLDELKEGARVEVNKAKRSPFDFVLWKAEKPGEPSWDSPWGKGRPGWHIECSALSMHYLGEQLDIHGGGQDLIFPHHENEIAQSEGVTEKTFARVWVHNGFVTLNQQKMSKSLGNFFTIEDILKKFAPMVVRLFLISQQYRTPIDFSDKKLEEFEKSYHNLQNTVQRVNSLPREDKTKNPLPDNIKKLEKIEFEFIAAMDDDMNTARALAEIFKSVNLINESIALPEFDSVFIGLISKKIEDLLERVLGITIKTVPSDTHNDDYINQLIAERAEARKKKDFKKSDEIRDAITTRGISIEDTPSGTRWWKKKE